MFIWFYLYFILCYSINFYVKTHQLIILNSCYNVFTVIFDRFNASCLYCFYDYNYHYLAWSEKANSFAENVPFIFTVN